MRQNRLQKRVIANDIKNQFTEIKSNLHLKAPNKQDQQQQIKGQSLSRTFFPVHKDGKTL